MNVMMMVVAMMMMMMMMMMVVLMMSMLISSIMIIIIIIIIVIDIIIMTTMSINAILPNTSIFAVTFICSIIKVKPAPTFTKTHSLHRPHSGSQRDYGLKRCVASTQAVVFAYLSHLTLCLSIATCVRVCTNLFFLKYPVESVVL